VIVTNVNGTCWSRVLARCCAVAMGTVIGVFYCMAAIRIFFVRGAQTWPGFLAWVAAVLALAFILPLSVLGAFKPRMAAFGVLTAAAAVLVCFVLACVEQRIEHHLSPLVFVGLVLAPTMPPCLVGGLLLYASGLRGGLGQREE